MKNPCAKPRKATEIPWATFNTPFGPAKVLKLWSVPKGKPSDAYTRVFVSCNGDMGDSYLFDYLRSDKPTQSTPEFDSILAEIARLYPMRARMPRPIL